MSTFCHDKTTTGVGPLYEQRELSLSLFFEKNCLSNIWGIVEDTSTACAKQAPTNRWATIYLWMQKRRC